MKLFVKLALTALTIPVFLLFVLIQGQTRAMVALAEDGASTFKAKCAMCHGADGSGDTTVGKSLKVRDLRSAEVQSQSDQQLYDILAKGKGKMPGYEKTLGADRCKELVAYIRTLKK